MVCNEFLCLVPDLGGKFSSRGYDDDSDVEVGFVVGAGEEALECRNEECEGFSSSCNIFSFANHSIMCKIVRSIF